MNKVLFSKKSDNWSTPETIYKRYIDELEYLIHVH